LPNFPVAQFSAAHFSGCRFFRGLFRFRYFRQFCVALFPTMSIFVAEFSYCPIFR